MKTEKKKKKLAEEIKKLQNSLNNSLAKKSSGAKEINLAEVLNKITAKQVELASLK